MTAPPRQRSSDPGTTSCRVLVTSAVFEPGFRGGGPVRSVAQTVDGVADWIDVTLLTSDRDLGAAGPYPQLSGRWVDRARTRVFYLNRRSPRQWLRIWRDVRRPGFDLLYVNSLWSPIFTMVPVLAARLGLIRARRILLAPRGELSAGALSIKARKKRLFLRWWRPVLRGASLVWHASTDREAADIRATFPWAEVQVCLNPISLPEQPHPPVINRSTPRLVYVGRIAALKNLALTLTALRSVHGPVEFDIYGPIEDAAYWARCQELIDALPGEIQVRYRGELPPAQVRSTMGGYDAFVMPTLGENFGHVIAESLSASCPVVCSDRTPWTETLEAGGGTVVRELTPEAFGRALREFADKSPVHRLRDRQAAAAAYRAWRAAVSGRNILDQTMAVR